MEGLSGGKNYSCKNCLEIVISFFLFFLFTNWLRQEGISVIFPEP